VVRELIMNRIIRLIFVALVTLVLSAPAVVRAECYIYVWGDDYLDTDCDGVRDFLTMDPDSDRIDNCPNVRNGTATMTRSTAT